MAQLKKLKISDLSVGDWVCYDRGTDAVQIMGIYVRNNQECVVMSDSYYPDGVIGFVEHIKPIPITPEILEKNGFEVYDDTARLKLDRPYALWLFKVQEGWDLHLPSREQHINLRIEHIHQLQHALRVAGVEKEIEV